MGQIISNKNGVYLKLTNEEFKKGYFVGCLEKWDPNGRKNSVVLIKIQGKVSDLKKCVVRKSVTESEGK